MTLLAEFKLANETFRKAMVPLGPSESLMSFWRSNGKLEEAVKKMDAVYGKLEDMQQAQKVYDDLFRTYFKKISDQLAKEKTELRPKAKPIVEKFEHGLETISITYRKDSVTLADTKLQDPIAKDFGKSVANDATDAAMVKIIAKVSAEFKRKREAHRDVAIAVEKKSRENLAEAVAMVDRMNKLVPQAISNQKSGKLRENQMMAVAATEQARKVASLADEAGQFYDQSLQPFFAERSMTVAMVATSMGYDIPKAYADDASREAEKHSKIFTEATKLTAAAKLANAKCRSADEQAAQILEQINDVVAGNDLAQSFLKGAANAVMRAKKLVDEANVDGAKLRNQTLPGILKAIIVKEAGKPENELPSAAATLKTLTPFLESALLVCLDQAATARKAVTDEKQKIPGQYLTGQTEKVLTTMEEQIDKLDVLLASVQKAAEKIIPRAQGLMD